MADSFTIQTDDSRVVDAFGRLPSEVERLLLAVAEDTANRILIGARDRLNRQTHGTGATADALHVVKDGQGYIVQTGPVRGRPANVPLWLELGTVKMHARPFLFAQADLEEGPHRRAVALALGAAVDRVTG